MNHRRLPALAAACVTCGLLIVIATPALAGGGLRVAPPSRSRGVLPRDDMERVRRLRFERWQQFPDVLTRPGQRLRAGLCEPQLPCPDTIRIAIVRIDFAADQGGDASTGDGHFDLSGPNPADPPIDPPPHNRAFFESHAEALRRYYDAQSYGDIAVVADVWPRLTNDAYSASDMADFGPWEFGPDLYAAAVSLFRAMAFAADSQSLIRGDRIPWDSYDRIAFIHAGSDHQSDLANDSPEDIPTFTIGVAGDDAVIFPDSTNRPITQASILPETISQDGFYGAINGIVAHESGHNCFGFYDVSDVGVDSTVVGLWSLMDAGPLAGAILTLADQSQLFATGLLPPSIDPFNRPFITPSIAPQDIAVGDTIWLPEIEGGSHIRRVVLNDDEYLLIENRFLAPDVAVELEQDPTTHVVLGPRYPNPLAYDSLLPGGGVLIWHVDEFVIRRDFALNMDPSRRGLELIEADGLDDLGDPTSPFMLGSATDPWYVGNNAELGSTTTPALTTHAGNTPPVIVSVLDPIQFEMRVSVVFDATTATLLAYFRAEPVDEGIEVRWQFAAPPAETAVDLERGDTEVGPWVTIARTLRVDRGEHVFVDRDAAPGRDYFYRLRSMSPSTGEVLFGTVSARGSSPSEELSLALAGANPVGRSPARIACSVAHESHLRISVVDLQGRRVAVLADEVAKPGLHTIEWDHASDARAGLYFVVAQSGGQRICRRLVIAP
jgi:M6 family metalloprotease-like protein